MEESKNFSGKKCAFNPEEIKSLFKRGQKKRKLTNEEKMELLSKIKYPYPGPQDSVELIDARLATICEILIQDIKIYPCFIPVFIKKIHSTFLLSVCDPGLPIGPHTADAISQQATQALLNTFHQAGTSKPGGSQGIKENIGISPKREQTYTVINFKNKRLSFVDVLKMKNQILGISIKDISSDIKTVYIDINSQLELNEPKNIDEANYMIENENYWWYKYFPSNSVLKHSVLFEEKVSLRLAIVIKLDIYKMFELKLTTAEIANKISERTFLINGGKEKNSEDRKYRFICYPSPTIFSQIHCFLSSEDGPDEYDYLNDYFLQQSISMNDFGDIYVSGIPKIENYYPVSNNVTSSIRSIEQAFKIEIIDGKKKEIPKGTWVYFKNMRFNPIPISRFISLCESCGLECVEDEEAVPISNLEFNSHKINTEKRTEIILNVKVQSEFDMHRQYRSYPYSLQKYNPELKTLNSEFHEIESLQKLEELINDEKQLSKYFSRVKKVYVYFSYQGKKQKEYISICQFYENREFKYKIEEGKPKSDYLIINSKSYSLNKKEEIYDIFYDMNKIYEYFKDYRVFYVKFQYEHKQKRKEVVIKQERVKNIKEELFTEKSREMIDSKVLYFISDFPVGKLLDEQSVEIESKEKLIELSKDNKECEEIFGNNYFPVGCFKYHYFLNNEENEIEVPIYLVAYRYYTYKVIIDVNRNKINDPKNYSSLNSLIASKYSIKNYKIPLEKPKIESVKAISEKEEQKLRKAILVKTFIPFTKGYYPDSIRNEKDPEKRKVEMDKYDRNKPIEKLISFLEENCDPKEREYVYAETKGSSLSEILHHPAIDKKTTYCNVFTEVLELYGIEAMRNLIDFDLGNVIAMSGHIDPLYIKHTADVLTSKGKNPFTSTGILSQGTGVLSMITFDKVEENLRKNVEQGKTFSVKSTSTSILIGNRIPLGTGFPQISVDRGKVASKMKLIENNSVDFKKIENIEDEGEVMQNFFVQKGKFPQVMNIISKYVKKRADFYINDQIELYKNAKLTDNIDISLVSFLDSYSNIKTVIDRDVFNYEPEPIIQIIKKRKVVG